VVPQLVAPLAAPPSRQSSQHYHSSSSSSSHSSRHERVMAATCEPCPTTQATGSHRRLPTPRNSLTNRIPVSDSDSDWMANEECATTRHSSSKFRGIKMAVDTDDDYYLNDDDALDNTYNPDQDYDSDILHCMPKIQPKSS